MEMNKAKYPIRKRFELNGVEFYIDSNCGMGRSGNYSVYCINDHKNLVTRARFDTCIRRIEERSNQT
jgi:hypothetical protein